MLPLHIDCSHVDDTLKSKPSRDRGRCDSMLACTGLGYDALFSQPLCKENLA
jgi:hypothetical protein